MLALYRKYRPQRFSEIFGQEHVKQTLRTEVEQGRIAHAYVFTGPRGTGKTSTARILAAAVNCEHPQTGEPCVRCKYCKSIKDGNFLDLIEIDAASQTGVDHVRTNIIETSRFIPQLGKFRVFIIDEAHMLSLAAWNALLKTLEEPPPHVLFILATTEVRKIPPTILSRCQHFHFKPLDEPTLKKRLHYILKQETVAADEEVVNEIATRAQGFVRDAESLLGLCLSLGLRKLTMASVHGILEKSPLDALCRIAQFTLDYDPVSALITLQELQKQGEHLDQLVHDLIDVFRAAHYYQLTRSDHPQFARRHGTKGMALIRSLVDKNSFSPETLLHALMIGTSRLPLLHYIPPDFFFELIISEIASISSKQLSVPSSRAKRSESSPPPRGGESPASAGSSVRAFARDSSTSVGMTNPQLSSKSITLDDIKHTWSQILTQAQERNQSLPFILKFAQLIKVDSPNIIHIGFPYQFHIERLKERDLTALMENVMSACVGMPVRLAFSLVDSKTLPSNSSPSLVSVLDMFEGKLVDE